MRINQFENVRLKEIKDQYVFIFPLHKSDYDMILRSKNILMAEKLTKKFTNGGCIILRLSISSSFSTCKTQFTTKTPPQESNTYLFQS